MILDYIPYLILCLLTMMTAPTKPPSAVSKNEEAIAYDTGDVKTRTEFLWDDMMIQPAEAVMANSHNDEMQHKPLVGLWYVSCET
jgi:hypothetical protein